METPITTKNSVPLPQGSQLTGAGHQIILYDGVCGLCNRTVKIILDRDPTGIFRFASLQSDLAKSILLSGGKDPSVVNSIYLVKGFGSDHVTLLAKAAAALEVAGQLHGPLRYLKIFSCLPAWLLNLGYDLVAANRYRIFGKHDSCPLPNPAHATRFLDQ